MQARKQGGQRGRYPRLFALRVARAQREALIREPLERELRVAASMIRELRHQLDELKRFMAAKISQHVLGRIGHEVSNILKREIVKALGSAMRNQGGIVRMEFSADDLRWSDPDSIERRVLADWKERSAPKLRVTFPKDGATLMEASSVTVLDVRIPELGYRQYVDRLALEDAR